MELIYSREHYDRHMSVIDTLGSLDTPNVKSDHEYVVNFIDLTPQGEKETPALDIREWDKEGTACSPGIVLSLEAANEFVAMLRDYDLLDPEYFEYSCPCDDDDDDEEGEG